MWYKSTPKSSENRTELLMNLSTFQNEPSEDENENQDVNDEEEEFETGDDDFETDEEEEIIGEETETKSTTSKHYK